MRRFINHYDQLSVVRSLNHEFTAASSDGVFAAAVVMTFDARTNTLVVSNAGHPSPLWYQSKRQRWTLLQPSAAAGVNGLPWGAPSRPHVPSDSPGDVQDVIGFVVRQMYLEQLHNAVGTGNF